MYIQHAQFYLITTGNINHNLVTIVTAEFQTLQACQKDSNPPTHIEVDKLLEVEASGADVVLDNSVGLVGGLELGVGDEVGAGLVAGGGDGLGDGDSQAVGALGHAEGPGRLLASTLLDLGELTTGTGGARSRALDPSGLHGAGLDDGEGVPGSLLVHWYV